MIKIKKSSCGEIWKPAKGFEKSYEVSSFGNVRSITREIYHPITKRTIIKGRMKSQYVTNRGYKGTSFYKNKKYYTVLIHRIVALTFFKKRKNKNTVNHIDGDKKNNNVQNLEWTSQKGNNHHAIKIGLVDNKGCNNPNSKLVPDDIRKIRKLALTRTRQSLSDQFKVSRATIGYIVNFKTWRNV